MRKLLVLLTVCLLSAGTLFAQKTITGKVTDDKGNPLSNASVMVPTWLGLRMNPSTARSASLRCS